MSQLVFALGKPKGDSHEEHEELEAES
jgi:hypothetical protein